MFSKILDWIRKITDDDTRCLKQADALAFEVMETEASDPMYWEKLDKLTTYINSCKYLRDREDYRLLLEGFVKLGDSATHSTAA
jgi:hypothetical protein